MTLQSDMYPVSRSLVNQNSQSPEVQMRHIEHTLCLMYEAGHPPASRPVGNLVAQGGGFETADYFSVQEDTVRRP